MHTTLNTPRTLARHDVSDLIGLRVVVANVAREIIDAEGETLIELPDMRALEAAAALARLLLPIRLRGGELRAIRHIADLTAAELAARMGDKTSPETISRWEHEKQPMGGYAEKVFRLVLGEALRPRAPGIGFEDGMIARMTVLDPWRVDPGFVVPPITLERVRMREGHSHELIETWGAEMPQAA